MKINPALHAEVIERYSKLDIKPYTGFINPVYVPVMKGGEIVDITCEYPETYTEQMLRYSSEYSFLPSKN